jgi:predicted acylesterase/phospholipase RssA
MRRLGLALSGGGFRASLFHLGLVRFLRDADLLRHVTHITSVSGGSIVAAHLVLNWSRYTGTPQEFEAAAAEVLRFIRFDVRNRILRRFLLGLPLRTAAWLLRRNYRQLTRTGLLEWHYEKYLYGDRGLFELPENPQLHILTTNVSEGCVCSFHRHGLLVQKRLPTGAFRFDLIPAGLATVPMAVAASSAFPGFFPPMELTSAEIGASEGDFSRQSFTDGGIFDNLGVRMFRCMEDSWKARDLSLGREDSLDVATLLKALKSAAAAADESPLRRLAQLLAAEAHKSLPAPDAADSASDATLVQCLRDLLGHYPLFREPAFAPLLPADPEVQRLVDSARSGRDLDSADLVSLNRRLVEAAFLQATSRSGGFSDGLAGVLVSDAGKRFKIIGQPRPGGFLRTALRATDIVMDRVWQLENETNADAPGFVFARISDVVEPSEDPNALHAEVQRRAATIRTDLDRFSELEISSLVRHGYSIARKTCRRRPDLFGERLPAGEPWDPSTLKRTDLGRPHLTANGAPNLAAQPTLEAMANCRALQKSALRRVWITLLDYRDWISYLYLPLLLFMLGVLPYLAVKNYHRSKRMDLLVASLAQGGPEFRELSRLLEQGPQEPWTGVAAEEVPTLDEPDFTGFELLQDSRIIDMRTWKPGRSSEAASWITSLRHLRVLKQLDSTGTNPFRARLLTHSPKVEVRFPTQQPEVKLRVCHPKDAGRDDSIWEAAFDLQKVPPGHMVDLTYQYLSFGGFPEEAEDLKSLRFPIQTATAELNMWMLMPADKHYRDFHLIRFPTGKPEKVEAVMFVAEYLAEDATILAFKLLSLKPGYTYEVRWTWRD